MFGLLMNVFETTAMPGFPYIIGAAIIVLAIGMTYRIPSEEEYFQYIEAKRASVGNAEEAMGLLE